VGVWAAYISLLEKITKEQINNVIILEDDCFQVRNFKLEDLGDKPIYLNGNFHHPTNYQEKKKQWILKLHKDFKFKNGINELDRTKLRMTGCLGIFIPKWEQASNIADNLKSLKRFTSIDSQISNQHLIQRFFYPALFRHSDFKNSNISKGYGEIEYWNEKEMNFIMKNM